MRASLFSGLIGRQAVFMVYTLKFVVCLKHICFPNIKKLHSRMP